MKKQINEFRLCASVAKGVNCSYGDTCRFSHDVSLWLANRPKDISSTCYLFEKYGVCKFGISCRFSENHIKLDDKGQLKNLINESLMSQTQVEQLYNVLSNDLKVKLWKRNYCFKKSFQINDQVKKYVNENGALKYNRNKGEKVCRFFSR
jgi:tRNA-dihydrouridine synthase 3